MYMINLIILTVVVIALVVFISSRYKDFSQMIDYDFDSNFTRYTKIERVIYSRLTARRYVRIGLIGRNKAKEFCAAISK